MDHHYSLDHTPVSCGLRLRSTADSDPQFFLQTRMVRSTYKLAKLWQNVSAEKQTMQLQAGAACASAVHVINADPFLNGSNTCRILRPQNLKICTPLIHTHGPRVL